jgi:putative acyl-CoA dehydrogenase
VMALDVLRVLQREPAAAQAVLDDIAEACRADAALAAGWESVQAILHEPRLLDARARSLVEKLAVLAAAIILKEHAPTEVSDAFLATRLNGRPRQTYGLGLGESAVRALLARASPRNG